MSDNAPLTNGNIRERLTVMEDGLRHSREISQMRDQAIREAFKRIETRNEKQDRNLEALEERLLLKIEKIFSLLWSGIRWGGSVLAVTLLTMVLKALNLV